MQRRFRCRLELGEGAHRRGCRGFLPLCVLMIHFRQLGGVEQLLDGGEQLGFFFFGVMLDQFREHLGGTGELTGAVTCGVDIREYGFSITRCSCIEVAYSNCWSCVARLLNAG